MRMERIEARRQAGGLSYRTLCAQEGVAYGSLMRWRERARRGVPLGEAPGPRKVASLDLEALREELRRLRHGRRRSEGTAALYRRHRDRISRRALGQLVAGERRRQNRERNRIYRQVSWRAPRLVWAMDETEYRPDPAYPKAYLGNVQDLGSRFKFPPLVGVSPSHGERIAAHLCALFERYGPPLFLKRDNGKNLNHARIEELLEAYLVLPLNSPCRYPQYNGAIEAGNREIKAELLRQPVLPQGFLALQAGLDIEGLNHRPRASLGYRSACDVFRAGHALAAQFHRRRRREVYETVKANALERMQQGCYDADAAWRQAVESSLVDQGFIAIEEPGEVSPTSPQTRSHH